MVVVDADVQKQFGGEREPLERPEPEDGAEIADVVEPVGIVDEEVPVLLQRQPFVNVPVAPRLQAVDDAGPDEMLLLDAVDLIEIVQVVRVHRRPRDVRVVHIRHDHMPQPVEAPERALHVLPGVVEFRVHLHADFADHAEFRAALGVVVRHPVAPGDALDLIRDEHRGELRLADLAFRRPRIRGQADARSRDDVDVPDLHRVVEHVERVEPQRVVIPDVPDVLVGDVAPWIVGGEEFVHLPVEPAPAHEKRREGHFALIVDVRKEFLPREIQPQFRQALHGRIEIVEAERHVRAGRESVVLVFQGRIGRRLVFGAETFGIVVPEIFVVADQVDLHPEVQAVREVRQVVRADFKAVVRDREAGIVLLVVGIVGQELVVPVFVAVAVVNAVERKLGGGFRRQQVGAEPVSDAAFLVPVQHQVHVPVRLVRELEVLRAADVPAPVALASELDLAAEARQVGGLVQDRQPEHRNAVDLEEIVLHQDPVVAELVVVVEEAVVAEIPAA